MHVLPQLIRRSRKDIVQAVVAAAREAGLDADAPQLEDGWQRALDCFVLPLERAIAEPALLKPAPIGEAHRHPLAREAIQAGRRHHDRAVPLSVFLALFKIFRRLLIAFAERSGSDGLEVTAARATLERLADLIELAVVADWPAIGEGDRDARLQAANREAVAERLKYMTVFESLATPAVLLDPEGAIEHANWAALGRFGRATAPGAGYYSRQVPTGLLDQLPAIVAAASQDRPVALATVTGTRRFRVLACPSLDVGNAPGTALLLTDVTDYLEELAVAAAVDRARASFVATMSHELRTPLHAMRGGLELLVKDRPEFARAPALVAIERAATLLEQRVDETLDYARLEAGEVPTRWAPTPLLACLLDTIEVVVPAVRAKGLALVVDLALPASLTLETDARKLQRIVINLLDNAVKFTDRGAVTLRARKLAPGDLVEIEVIDTGPGFEPTEAALLFEPFVQLPATRTEPAVDGANLSSGRGAGLGLAICRRLADALDIQIDTESRPGQGSRFRLLVPLSPPPAGQVDAGELAARILLVEDDEPSRVVAAGLLSHAGAEVTTAPSAADAWRAARRTSPDAVVLDIRLPDSAGTTLAAQLRRRWPTLPLIVLTAEGGVVVARAAAAAGVDRVLRKPDDLPRLVAMLAEVRRSGRTQPVTPADAIDRTRLSVHVDALGHAAVAGAIASLRQSATTAVDALHTLREPNGGDDAPLLANATDRLHALAGGAVQLGLNALGQRCAGLEILALAGDAAGLVHEIEAFEHDLEAAFAAVTRDLAALRRG